MNFSTVYPISTPHAYKIKKMLKFINLYVCLSVFLSACQSVCFSVCIRKQLSITQKLHNHYDEENSTQSHDNKKAFKVNQSVQFSGSFPQQNDCKTNV